MASAALKGILEFKNNKSKQSTSYEQLFLYGDMLRII